MLSNHVNGCTYNCCNHAIICIITIRSSLDAQSIYSILQYSDMDLLYSCSKEECICLPYPSLKLLYSIWHILLLVLVYKGISCRSNISIFASLGKSLAAYLNSILLYDPFLRLPAIPSIFTCMSLIKRRNITLKYICTQYMKTYVGCCSKTVSWDKYARYLMQRDKQYIL